MIFTKEIYKIIFKDKYIIIDCAIKSFDRQIYLLVEDDDEKIKNGDLPLFRFLYTYNEYAPDPKECFYASHRNDLNNPKIAFNTNGNELIAVDMMGNLHSHSAGDREENKLSQELRGSDYNGIYTNIKTIGGSIYATGFPYLLYKRNGVNDWENVSESIQLQKETFDGSLEGGEDFGWEDLDGFSETDIYLGGGDGEVWHYDGSRFKQCDFPSSESIFNVCCAGDGYVYIGGRGGLLWKGKNNTWKLVSNHQSNGRWKDIEWFDNRLFLRSDYGLWELKDNKVFSADIPLEVKSCSGSLSVCPEKKYLLTASRNGSAMYDGKEWTVLFDGFNLPDR